MLALIGDDADEVRSAMATGGIDGFLTKPVDLEALRGEVTRLMAGQRPGTCASTGGSSIDGGGSGTRKAHIYKEKRAGVALAGHGFP